MKPLHIDFLQMSKVPYKENGRTLEEGLDCYGFIVLMYRQVGVELPDLFKPNTDWSEYGGYLHYLQLFENMTHQVFEDYHHGDFILFNDDYGVATHMGLIWDRVYFVHFVSDHGFAKSKLSLWSRKINSIWRLND